MNFKKVKFIPAILTCSLIFGIIPSNTISASTYVSTDYINETKQGNMLVHYSRDKVTTYYEGVSSVSYSTKQPLGSVTNTHSTPQVMGGSYSKTRSRTFSLSAKVTKNILKHAVDLTIGGSLTYSETVTLSASYNIPGNTTHTFYYQMRTQTDKYKHIVQRQTKTLESNYSNYGSPSTSYSYVYSKSPHIVI